jgi:hypothetical protein
MRSFLFSTLHLRKSCTPPYPSNMTPLAIPNRHRPHLCKGVPKVAAGYGRRNHRAGVRPYQGFWVTYNRLLEISNSDYNTGKVLDIRRIFLFLGLTDKY